MDVVHNSWNETVIGCPMYILNTKLKRLKEELKVWNRETFGNIHDYVRVAELHLHDIQQQIHTNGHSDHLMNLEKNAQCELDKALDKQDLFWKEKSRTTWHSDGDRNTTYFHRLTKIKNATKIISSLKNGNELITEPNQLADHGELF
jgi:hypothetical protein